jgi:cephalosporin hydroxylase
LVKEPNPQIKSIKWQHYDEIYPKHFPKNPRTILEIGIREGGSLIRWHQEFPKATVFGIDINPAGGQLCENVHCYTGSQSDKDLLNDVGTAEHGLDIVIDDGSHRPYHQVASFKTLWPHVREGGCYIVEDMHMQGKWRWKLWNLFMPNIYRIAQRMAKSQDRPIKDTESATRDFSIHIYPHCIVFQKQKMVMRSVERDYLPA